MADPNRSQIDHASLAASLAAAGYPANLHLISRSSYPLFTILARTTDEFNATYQTTLSLAILDRDDTAPVITRLGEEVIEHQVWRPYHDPGAVATDTLDGNVTASIVTANPVEIDKLKSIHERMNSEYNKIFKFAVAKNQGDHLLLAEGIFPRRAFEDPLLLDEHRLRPLR